MLNLGSQSEWVGSATYSGSAFIFFVWISLLLGVTSIDAFASQTWKHMPPDSRGHGVCGPYL